MGLLVVQQLIVASSTIWITRLIAHIQQGSFSYPLLALYLASLFLPYFPGAAALVGMAKAKMKANVHYVNSFASLYRGQIMEWTNATKHSTTSSILTGEAPQAINGYFDYLYHFASCGLNVLFNLLIVALIIEPWLLGTYVIGVLLAFSVLRMQKKWRKILSLRAQQGRIKWVEMLLKAWDNILINNSYNFNIWKKKADKRGNRLVSSQVKLEGLSQGTSVIMAFLLLAPSFGLIGYLPILRGYNLMLLAIMVVTLPRLFQVLSYSYEMLFLLADFPMQKSRMRTVVNLLEITHLPDSQQAHEHIEQRIRWDKIHVTFNADHISSRALIGALPVKGRYTIKGENGSGKSSLLLLLKMLKGQEAVYLPVKHDLLFQLSKNGFSTGQFAHKALNELLGNPEASVVLLDEWDANLDAVNQKQLSELIDQIAQEKCVVEVRHR